jgi:hypothetical protein
MGQMAVRCCRSPRRSTIVNRGCREFVLLFQGSLIPSFFLIINAPNASRNDLAGAPISLGEVLSIFCFKFWPGNKPSPDRPAVIFCHLSSWEEFKVEGWGPEVAQLFGTWLSVKQESWTIISRFFLALLHLFSVRKPTAALFFSPYSASPM